MGSGSVKMSLKVREKLKARVMHLGFWMLMQTVKLMVIPMVKHFHLGLRILEKRFH